PMRAPALAGARPRGLAPDLVPQALAARPVLVLGPLRPIAEGHLAATGFTVSGARQIEHLDLMPAPLVITSSYLVPGLHSATWLSDREVDHVQVVLGESVVEIAGLVRPGRTPCTVC